MKNGFYFMLTLAAPGFFGLVLPRGGEGGAEGAHNSGRVEL